MRERDTPRRIIRGVVVGADVVVLVTCTNRKTVQPASSLRLRAVPGRSICERAAVWRESLATAKGEVVLAEALYAGDHWQVVRSLDDLASRQMLGLRTFVCSAGYGLLDTGAPVHSYSATFSPGNPDSITRGVKNGGASAARRSWWRELGEWEGPSPGSPRSIKHLINIHANSSILIAISPPYLDAVTDDLADALASTSPNRVAVFSAGTGTHPVFEKNLIPCNARLQRLLGGARVSLNVRCLRHAIERLPPDKLAVRDLRRYFSRLLARQPDLQEPNRTALSDEEVAVFIRATLGKDPTARPSLILKELRGSGRACEQSRFSALFRGVAKEGGNG